MLKWLANWHPQARLAVLFIITFVMLQACYIAFVLTLPSALTPNAATALLVALPMWVLTAGVATVYLFFNAFRLLRKYQRRYNYAPRRNLIVTWGAPFVLIGLILFVTETSLIESVFEWRRDRSFNSSREDMLTICETILEDGPGSPLIRSSTTVGVFSQVRISLRQDDQQVWFDVGDSSGEIGYICLEPSETVPLDDDTYIYEPQDDRFVFYREREDVRRERLEETEDDDETQ